MLSNEVNSSMSSGSVCTPKDSSINVTSVIVANESHPSTLVMLAVGIFAAGMLGNSVFNISTRRSLIVFIIDLHSLDEIVAGRHGRIESAVRHIADAPCSLTSGQTCPAWGCFSPSGGSRSEESRRRIAQTGSAGIG